MNYYYLAWINGICVDAGRDREYLRTCNPGADYTQHDGAENALIYAIARAKRERQI